MVSALDKSENALQRRGERMMFEHLFEGNKRERNTDI